MYLVFLIVLLDGSQVNLKVPESTTWEYKMSYGNLKIPIKDIQDIQLGIHLDDEAPYVQAANNLSSNNYGERDKATKFLRNNPRGAFKFIYPLKNSKYPETYQRVDQLLSNYKTLPPSSDFIVTKDCNLSTGFLTLTEIQGESESLGKLTIKMSQVKSIFTKRTATIDLLPEQDWTVLDYVSGQFSVKATGQVDLWPMTPGAYQCGPKGHTTLNGSYNSGALLGRINGTVFVIGENYNGNGSGKLEIRINGVPWPGGTTPLGSYKVNLE